MFASSSVTVGLVFAIRVGCRVAGLRVNNRLIKKRLITLISHRGELRC